MHRGIVIGVLLLGGWTFAAEGQKPAAPPPADSALAGITERGRQLAEYDHAAWVATDAMLARWPNPTGITGFLALRSPNGDWRVLFARLSEGKDTLLIVVTAVQGASPDSFNVTLHDPPRIGSDVERRAFRALKTAGADLVAAPPPWREPYNTYVLPRQDGSWWVFYLPATTRSGVYPHGGDFRYVVSADGATIISKFQMHRTVLMSAVPANAVAGIHTVITGDVPMESCVFLVLSRQPSKPELVGTAHFDFEIHRDGSIEWRYGKRDP